MGHFRYFAFYILKSKKNLKCLNKKIEGKGPNRKTKQNK